MPNVGIVGRQRGPTKSKFNILFLGDGFEPGDLSLFNTAVENISQRMFKQRPFNLAGMRNHFNIFRSFTYSPGSGITCQAGVDMDGKPAIGGSVIGVPTPKNSIFGLYYDASSPRVIKAASAATIPTYIASLSHPTEPLGASDIPGCWAPGGKSYGFVIVLVNDDLHGGAMLGPVGATYGAAVTLGHLDHLNLISHIPVEHEPASPRNRWEQTAAVTIHELGHSGFGLGDEYVDTTLGAAGNEQNICSELQGMGGIAGGTFWTHLKWNKVRYPGGPNIITQPELDKILPTFVAPPQPPHATAAAAATAVSIHCPGGGGIPKSYTRMYPKPGRAPKMAHTWKFVGLYQGAKGDHCDIYRPAGDCKMRVHIYGGESFPGHRRRHVQFCYVCKWEIVNKIDPTLLQKLSNRLYP